MGRRLVSVIGRVKGGAARGGTGRTIKFWDDENLSIASTVYRRSSGVGQQPNPLTPNAGIPTTLLVDRLSTDAFVTVTSVAAFNVGDLIPIYDGTNTVYKVVTIITPGTRRLDLDSALGFNFAAANTIVNAADMEGHIWAWLDDATDKFAQVTEVASGRKLPPLEFPIAVPISAIAIYEEGTIAGTRPAINFIGPNLLAVDNGGANRVDITDTAAPRAATYVVGAADGTLTAELVLGTAVIMRGTAASRPAASLAGRLYNSTDTAGGRLERDNGASWDKYAEDETHASSHNSGGADALTIDAAAGTGSLRTLGTSATSAAPGDHNAAHEPGGGDPMAVDAAAGTGSLRTIGSGATQAAAGNHTHTAVHIEAKNSAGAASSESVTWTSAFGVSNPVVACSGAANASDRGCNVTARSSTGATGNLGTAGVQMFIAMEAN